MATTNPVTLAEFALTTTDKVLSKFVKTLIRESKAMGSVPFMNSDVLSVVNKKWQTLPAGQTRNLNEGYSQVKGTTKDETWEPSIYGGDIAIDRLLKNVSNAIESEVSLQTKMFIAGMAADWTYDFIANDGVTNPKGMVGLKALATSYQNSKMLINVGTGSAVLDVTNSSANMNKFINALERAIKYVGGERGGKVCLYMNENTYLGVSAALRAANLLDTTKDQFDRQFNTFAGAPLIDVGLKSDRTTEIIPLTETDNATADGTSIYVVRWDENDGAIGIQNGNLDVYDPLGGREMETQPATLLRCDWATMIIPRSDFCIARIYGIKNPALWTITI